LRTRHAVRRSSGWRWRRALKQIVNERLASALGIPIGFNAMDGD
jgi:predicted lipoprotein